MSESRAPEPNMDEVICPQCCHQFHAIPWNVQKDLAAARAEVERLRKDAERYLFIRKREEFPEIFVGVDSDKYEGKWALMDADADAAIDAALAAQEPKNGS